MGYLDNIRTWRTSDSHAAKYWGNAGWSEPKRCASGSCPRCVQSSASRDMRCAATRSRHSRRLSSTMTLDRQTEIGHCLSHSATSFFAPCFGGWDPDDRYTSSCDDDEPITRRLKVHQAQLVQVRVGLQERRRARSIGHGVCSVPQPQAELSIIGRELHRPSPAQCGERVVRGWNERPRQLRLKSCSRGPRSIFAPFCDAEDSEDFNASVYPSSTRSGSKDQEVVPHVSSHRLLANQTLSRGGLDQSYNCARVTVRRRRQSLDTLEDEVREPLRRPPSPLPRPLP